MDHVFTTPAPARSDVLVTGPAGPTPCSTTTVRRLGLTLAAGAATWAAASYVYGFTPTSEAGIRATDLAALLFQVGVMALLQVQIATRATGTRPISRRLLKVERVLLGLAMLWSVAHALLPAQRDAVWMGVLDVFWPLSMLGMFFIGIKVAVAGRWRGPARVWSLLAESWAPVSLPAVALLGPGLGDVVAATHLLLGYTTLGLVIATRPDLVEDRG